MATEGKCYRVKCKETSFEEEGFVKILQDFPCIVVINMEQKTKQKRGRYGVGNKIKNDIKVGSLTGGPP